MRKRSKIYFITKEGAEERERDFRAQKEMIMKELKGEVKKTIITN